MDEDSRADSWPFHNVDLAICKAFTEKGLMLDFNSALSVSSNILSNCVTGLGDTARRKGIKRFTIVSLFLQEQR